MIAVPARRRQAIKVACRAAGIPLYAHDLVTVRGRCLARRCASRWGVVRVSLDFTGERVDRLATVECASCGRTWRRCKVPAIRSAAGYQAVRLTLILPGDMKRWFSRGRWHREGDDAIVVRDGTLSDVDDAARAHCKREDAKADAKARRKAREAAATAALIARLEAASAAAAAAREAAAADEAAAAAREAAYA